MKLLKVFAALSFVLLSVSLAIPQARPVASAPVVTVAPAPATTVAGTSVTTTAPVTSTTTIQTGTIAGQALLWVVAVFGSTAGSVLTAWLWRLFKMAGIDATDALRARFKEIVVNGLNAGAAALADKLHDKGQIVVKNAIVGYAVAYAQTHGEETLKALGEQPGTEKAIEAIKARIETAIADPATPTPAVLDKTAPASPIASPAKPFDPNRTGL